MGTGLVANASSTIGAPRETVWHALVTPEEIERYMFGAKVASEWREGSGDARRFEEAPGALTGAC